MTVLSGMFWVAVRVRTLLATQRVEDRQRRRTQRPSVSSLAVYTSSWPVTGFPTSIRNVTSVPGARRRP